MKTTLLLGACAVGMLSVGCLQDRTYLDPNQNLDPFASSSSSSTMNLKNGRLQGDIGGRRGFSGDATRLEGMNDPAYDTTSVNVVRTQEGTGAAMVILNISGRSLDRLSVGEHAFSASDFGSDVVVYSNVCSSGLADDSSFDYDAPVDQGTITIEDAPDGTRTVDVHTETRPIDPSTGEPLDGIEITDSSFAFTAGGQG